uniref:Uncharacterized protein n=1 Tax=Arundo donax TaxID=35708 RepID=A0A0A8Z799_ARUDO
MRSSLTKVSHRVIYVYILFRFLLVLFCMNSDWFFQYKQGELLWSKIGCYF